jgi:mannose-6-phosphate isomerase-like protein (cupin superfamily)
MHPVTFLCVVTLITSALPALGQSPTAARASTTTGTVVTARDLAAAITRADTASVIDRTLRLVPVGTEYNVAVSIVRRTQVDGQTPPDALMHDEITEIYHILEGRGVMVTGGVIEAALPLPADGPVVRYLVGPSVRGQAIVGGSSREVGPGDIVVVPPSTPHGFAQLQTPEIRYVVIRVDPHRVLQPAPGQGGTR